VQIWSDEFLVWKPEEYGGIRSIIIPPSHIWTPDLEVYNMYQSHYFDFTSINNILKLLMLERHLANRLDLSGPRKRGKGRFEESNSAAKTCNCEYKESYSEFYQITSN